MNQPNQRGGGGGFRQAQQASPLAIRTKKTQLTTDTYTKMVMGEVWKKDWVYALIPFALGLVPALFVHSWWWIVLAVVLTILFVLFRSAQVTGITQMEQSKPLFERMAFEMDNKQLLLRVGPEKEGKAMQLTWDMIGRVRRDADAYVLYLKPGTPPADMPPGACGWHVRSMCRCFYTCPSKFLTPITTADCLSLCCAAKACCPPKLARPPSNY